MKKNGPNSFEVFVDEHSPDQAIEMDRIWKKKLNEQKNKRYTIIMLSAVVVMIVIFASLMILFDSSTSPKKHQQLQEITYMNTKYTYLQSNIPHLRFLVPQQDTKQIKILKTMGIIYSEILAWIDSNVAPKHQVLYIPNENTMVNVLGIALGYYLKQSKGGQLTIGVTAIKYSQMTAKNIELMNVGRQEDMPIKVVPLDKLQQKEYDLIVLENSNYYKSLNQTTDAMILIIRKESEKTTIKDSFFLAHRKYQLVKGRTSIEIRALPAQYGYALINYIPSGKRETSNILLIPDSDQNVELCEEASIELAQKPWIRNLVQRLKNESFADTSIYYAIDSPAALQIISSLPVSKIYTINSPSNKSNVILIKTINQFVRASHNIFIVTAKDSLNLYIEIGDQLFVEITSEQQRVKIASKFSKFNISIVSPFNNKGCFYPPALLDPISKPLNLGYFMLISAKKGQQSPEN